MTDSQIFGLIFIALGLMLVVGTVLMRHRTLRLYRIGETANASVTSVSARSGEAGTSYRTSVKFVLGNGDTTYESFAGLIRYREGNEVMVVYDPSNPSRLDVYSLEVASSSGGAFALGWMWWVTALFVVPGIALFVFSLWDL